MKPFLSKEFATHLKCNACKFLIKVALWKVKPMKLIPLDSTTIYPINTVIYQPLIALWPTKIKTLAFTFALSSFPTHDIQDILVHISWAHHFTGLTYSYISNKNVSPRWLSLITKTRIRGLDAFRSKRLPSTVAAAVASRSVNGRRRMGSWSVWGWESGWASTSMLRREAGGAGGVMPQGGGSGRRRDARRVRCRVELTA
jgi:hypothetical protein